MSAFSLVSVCKQVTQLNHSFTIMGRKMFLQTDTFWFPVLVIIFIKNCAVLSGERCYQYRRKANVTLDTDQCLWENYTEPKTKRYCLESCFENATVRTNTFNKNRTSRIGFFLHIQIYSAKSSFSNLHSEGYGAPYIDCNAIFLPKWGINFREFSVFTESDKSLLSFWCWDLSLSYNLINLLELIKII